MNPNASTKLWNSISRCSLPSTTAQPSGVDAAIPKTLGHDLDRGSHRGEIGQPRDVVVGQPDAPVAHELADELGTVRAVDRDLTGSATEALQHVTEAGHAQLVRPVGTVRTVHL